MNYITVFTRTQENTGTDPAFFFKRGLRPLMVLSLPNWHKVTLFVKKINKQGARLSLYQIEFATKTNSTIARLHDHKLRIDKITLKVKNKSMHIYPHVVKITTTPFCQFESNSKYNLQKDAIDGGDIFQ